MKNKNIIIGVLALIIVILSGYIIYDKVLLDDKIDVVDKDNLDDDKNLDNNGDNKVEDKAENNNENDVDNSENDNVGNNNDDVIVDENDNIEKITGNYMDYTEDCGYDNPKCTINYTFKNNSNYTSTISVSDIFFNSAMPEFGNKFFILHNGFLYYDFKKCTDKGYCNFFGNGLFANGKRSDEGYLSNLKKFTSISNIKRIKAYNSGGDISYDLLLITNAGDVYSFNVNENNKTYFSKIDELAKYEVDDIISYKYVVPFGDVFEVILKDGTILTKSFESE